MGIGQLTLIYKPL